MGRVQSMHKTKKAVWLFCFIDNVKVDIIRYPHNPISEIKVEDGIRMYSDADIAAMKIQAMLGRGKKKDFWDICELLNYVNIQQLIE